jgi:hypothetical protein
MISSAAGGKRAELLRKELGELELEVARLEASMAEPSQRGVVYRSRRRPAR